MSRAKKGVLIVGTGTIGEPLIHLFAKSKKEIDIGRVFFHKRTPLIEEVGKVKDMQNAGAYLVADNNETTFSKFKEIGLEPVMTIDECMRTADVVIDCTPEGNKLKAKFYESASNPKGFIAQGSEAGFGIPYAWTINDSALKTDTRFIQVVSCNTHQILCILNSLILRHTAIDNLSFANFTIIRRASDMSEDKGILGMEAEKTSHAPYGSHQAFDAVRVLKTLGKNDFDLPVFAQALKAPTQYMHTIAFNIEQKNALNWRDAWTLLKSNKLVAFTKFKSTNRVFARARDSSRTILGRILNQTVFFEPSLYVSGDGSRISGVCFTPQDGNALLSSVAATLWLLDPKTYREKMNVFDKFLFEE